MEENIDHTLTEEFNEAMELVHSYFDFSPWFFYTNVAGHCSIKAGIEKNLNLKLSEFMDKIRNDTKPENSFWWEEWIQLNKYIEESLDIKLPDKNFKNFKVDKEEKSIFNVISLNFEMHIENYCSNISRIMHNHQLDLYSLYYEEVEPSNNWSSEITRITKNVFRELPIESFFQGYCILKNLDYRYGKIMLNDAINNNYKIVDIDDDSILEEYSNLDEMIKAGWVID